MDKLKNIQNPKEKLLAIFTAIIVSLLISGYTVQISQTANAQYMEDDQGYYGNDDGSFTSGSTGGIYSNDGSDKYCPYGGYHPYRGC